MTSRREGVGGLAFSWNETSTQGLGHRSVKGGGEGGSEKVQICLTSFMNDPHNELVIKFQHKKGWIGDIWNLRIEFYIAP